MKYYIKEFGDGFFSFLLSFQAVLEVLDDGDCLEVIFEVRETPVISPWAQHKMCQVQAPSRVAKEQSVKSGVLKTGGQMTSLWNISTFKMFSFKSIHITIQFTLCSNYLICIYML